MISERKMARFQLGLLLLAGMLIAYYWFGYRSLSAWARDLDKPTADAWKRLVAAAQASPHVRSLDESVLKSSVQQLRQATTMLQQAAKAAYVRTALEEDTRSHLGEEFQLLDFDKARLQVSLELRRAAGAKKVALIEPALKGLPEYDPDMSQPALHWAQLSFARQLLAVAIAAAPRAASNLTILPVKSHDQGEGLQVLYELPMRLELAGSPASLMAFLAGLPLRGEEFKAAGLPEVAGKTQPLFMDRLILKNAQSNPDEAVLDIVAVGFCELPRTELRR